MNTAVRDIEGKSINSIQVTTKISSPKITTVCVKIALGNIYTVYFGLYYKPGDQIVQNYNFMCFVWLFV
jgi:hypothetical protein